MAITQLWRGARPTCDENEGEDRAEAVFLQEPDGKVISGSATNVSVTNAKAAAATEGNIQERGAEEADLKDTNTARVDAEAVGAGDTGVEIADAKDAEAQFAEARMTPDEVRKAEEIRKGTAVLNAIAAWSSTTHPRLTEQFYEYPYMILYEIMHAKLAWFLEAPFSLAEKEVYEGLVKMYHAPSSVDRKCQVAHRIFEDLDTLLFKGALKGRVTVHWRTIKHIPPRDAFTMPFGGSEDPGAAIVLDHECAWYGPGRDRAWVWGCLLHEMLHAFITVSSHQISSRVKELCVCGAEVSHGPMFAESTRRLAQKLDLPGLDTAAIHVTGGYCHVWNSAFEEKANLGMVPRFLDLDTDG